MPSNPICLMLSELQIKPTEYGPETINRVAG